MHPFRAAFSIAMDDSQLHVFFLALDGVDDRLRALAWVFVALEAVQVGPAVAWADAGDHAVVAEQRAR